MNLLVLQCESESCGPSLAVLDLRPYFCHLPGHEIRPTEDLGGLGNL
jgi:hypothetical protein